MRSELIRRAAVDDGSFGRLVLRLRAQAGPAGTLRRRASSMHGGVSGCIPGLSRVTMMLRTGCGSRFHWARKPLTWVSKPGLGIVAATTNTVVTSGWRPNQATVWSFHLRHSSARDFGVRLTTVLNAQLVSVLEIPRQWRFLPTGESTARHADAWLSPTSATVVAACFARAPHQQVRTRSSTCRRLQIEFGLSSAWFGVGVTFSRRFGLLQGFCGSREAAP